MTTETTVEQTASTPVPVENVASTTTDEGKVPESVKTDTPAPDAAETAKATEEKRKGTAKDRINELTRDKYQLKEEKARLEAELNQLRQQNHPREPVKPKLADFGSDTEYEAAMDQYHLTRRDYDSAQASERETQQQEVQRKQAEADKAAQKFVTDMNKEKANYEGIETVMADPAFALVVKHMSLDLRNLIQTSDKNIALAYHLGTHLDEAEEIASLPLAQAARKLALLESRLEIPKPKTVTNAPPPVKPVNGGSVKERDISDPNLSDAEFNEMRRKENAARRRR